MRDLVLVMLCVVGVPVLAGAQSPTTTTVRVVRESAVLEQPVGEARALGTAAVGEILDVLDERTGWYLVRPPAGAPAREWRTGWVAGATVEPINRATAAPGAQVQPAPAPEEPRSTSNRRGFIIGIGAGGGLHSTPSFDVFDRFGRLVSTIGGESQFAVVTNFLVGWAPTDRALLYYSNKAAFTTDESYDALGITGFGMTYMFRQASPTWYVTGSIGAGFGASLVSSSTAETGLGWSGGVGWEFARHLSLEGDMLFVGLGSGDSHKVYRGLFTFTFY